jgi:hypothetical protein
MKKTYQRPRQCNWHWLGPDFVIRTCGGWICRAGGGGGPRGNSGGCCVKGGGCHVKGGGCRGWLFPFDLFVLSHVLTNGRPTRFNPRDPSHGYGFGTGTNIGTRTRTLAYPSQIPARVCVPVIFTNQNSEAPTRWRAPSTSDPGHSVGHRQCGLHSRASRVIRA